MRPLINKPPWKHWHMVVQQRDEPWSGEASLNVYAADLYDVAMGKAHPAQLSLFDEQLFRGAVEVKS